MLRRETDRDNVQICLLGCTAVRALMMEAARTSETSVDNYFTRQYIPEDKSELHTRRRENLKYQIAIK
jgi:predicted anti-sigma-YlaC factor YlaD